MGPMARSMVPRSAFPIPERMRLYWAESIRIPGGPGPGYPLLWPADTRVSEVPTPTPSDPRACWPRASEVVVVRASGIRGPRPKSHVGWASQPFGRWRARWRCLRLAHLQPLKQGPVWP